MRRLNESVRRILPLKWRLGLSAHKLTPSSRVTKVVGTPQHLAAAEDISNRSITLLKNSAGLLPLARNTGKKVLVTGFGETTTATLGQDLASRGLVPQVLATGSNPSPTQIEQAVAAAKASDLVLLTTFNAWSSPSQLQLVNALLLSGAPVIVYAVGTPYDIAYFPSASTFITGYDYQPVSHHAAVRAMFGEIPITGKLPVTIRAPAPSTKVLYPFGYGIGLPR